MPLLILLDRRPVKSLPEEAGVAELYRDPTDRRPLLTTEPTPLFCWKRCFLVLDRLVKMVEASRVRPLRKRALEMAQTWVLEHQEESGDWLGIQPAIVNSMLALISLGHDAVDGSADGPVQKGFEALKRFTIESEDKLCSSPVFRLYGTRL